MKDVCEAVLFIAGNRKVKNKHDLKNRLDTVLLDLWLSEGIHRRIAFIALAE